MYLCPWLERSEKVSDEKKKERQQNMERKQATRVLENWKIGEKESRESLNHFF